jgi:hypothetical protein
MGLTATDSRGEPGMNGLELTAQRQALWSQTANALKKRYELARAWSFGFTIVGALAAMLASQLAEGTPRVFVAVTSSVLFGLVSFLTARSLGQERAASWVRARAAAEALKREAYRYAAQAAPYDTADKDVRLASERARIEKDVDDLLAEAVTSGGKSNIPQAVLTPAEYLAQRIQKQIDEYLEPKANQAQKDARTFRIAESCLAFATAVITAIVGVAGKDPLGWHFDFVAMTTVLTTISGTILAHIETSRYDFTASRYRATTRRLNEALATGATAFVAPSAEWSAFVNQCEGILADENSSWIAKWSKTSSSAAS